MKLVATPLPGLLRIEPEPHTDARGLFARIYDESLFAAHGLPTRWPQWNLSHNVRRGTLRGLHFQRAPHEEPKIVRCSRGRIYDVAVDLRADSPTYLRWLGLELDADSRIALYIPPGFAHGFQTLTDDAEVSYHMGDAYHPELADGVRWDDPAFGISWPLPNPILSPRDAAFPDLGSR
jgi:dTDP-4-dehydrorhamnose 3,5-epimerase